MRTVPLLLLLLLSKICEERLGSRQASYPNPTQEECLSALGPDNFSVAGTVSADEDVLKISVLLMRKNRASAAATAAAGAPPRGQLDCNSDQPGLHRCIMLVVAIHVTLVYGVSKAVRQE